MFLKLQSSFGSKLVNYSSKLTVTQTLISDDSYNPNNNPNNNNNNPNSNEYPNEEEGPEGQEPGRNAQGREDPEDIYFDHEFKTLGGPEPVERVKPRTFFEDFRGMQILNSKLVKLFEILEFL